MYPPAPKDPLDEAYSLLQVSKETSLADITRAWKKLSVVNHPDKHPQEEVHIWTEKMIKINEALEEIRLKRG